MIIQANASFKYRDEAEKELFDNLGIDNESGEEIVRVCFRSEYMAVANEFSEDRTTIGFIGGERFTVLMKFDDVRRAMELEP